MDVFFRFVSFRKHHTKQTVDILPRRTHVLKRAYRWPNLVGRNNEMCAQSISAQTNSLFSKEPFRTITLPLLAGVVS